METTNYNRNKRYKKDKKLTIMELKEPDNGLPGRPRLIPIQGGENIWAYYRHASASEVNNAGLAGYKVEAVFHIN